MTGRNLDVFPFGFGASFVETPEWQWREHVEGPFESGDRVLVEFPGDSWQPGVFEDYVSSTDVREDFLRLTVRLDDGGICRGCHPRCVRADRS